MKTRSDPSAGFTLIEMLVVMGVLALLLAIVLAAKPQSAEARVNAAAKSLVASFQIARSQAISTNQETVVRVDMQPSRFGQANAMYTLPRGMALFLTVADSERVGDSGGLRFYPDGQSSGGEVVIELDGRKSRVAVNWLTGEARLIR